MVAFYPDPFKPYPFQIDILNILITSPNHDFELNYFLLIIAELNIHLLHVLQFIRFIDTATILNIFLCFGLLLDHNLVSSLVVYLELTHILNNIIIFIFFFFLLNYLIVLTVHPTNNMIHNPHKLGANVYIANLLFVR